MAAVVLLGAGCGGPPPIKGKKPRVESNRVILDDIQSYAKTIKHKGVVNKKLVRFLVGQRQYILALQHTETLLKKDPDDAELHFLKGFSLRELGQYQDAEEALKTAVSLHNGYAEAWNALGMTYDLMHKPEDAEKAYLEALRINPTSSKYLNNLGFSYFSRGRYSQAVELFQKALASDPNNVQIHNNLGYAYGMLGRYEEAKEEFKQAGRKEVVYNNLGFLYYMLGYTDEAKVMYAKALEVNPSFYRARNNLRLLEEETGHDGPIQEVLEKNP